MSNKLKFIFYSFINNIIRTMYKVMIRKLCIPQDSSSKMTRVNLKILPSNHRYLLEIKKKKKKLILSS